LSSLIEDFVQMLDLSLQLGILAAINIVVVLGVCVFLVGVSRPTLLLESLEVPLGWQLHLHELHEKLG